MKTLLTILALAFTSTSAIAHDDATLDQMQAANGGQLRMAGMYHFELVVAKDSPAAKDKPLAVYLTDHADKKMSSAGASGTATILAGKVKTTIKLAPAGDNKLAGVGAYASQPDMKVIVSVTFVDKTTELARFMPLAKAAHGGH